MNPSETYRDTIIDKWVERIARWNLTAPAIFFLEMHKPLSFVGSQALLLAQPFFTGWGNDAAVRELAELLADRANVERMIARLERSTKTHEGTRRQTHEGTRRQTHEGTRRQTHEDRRTQTHEDARRQTHEGHENLGRSE